LMGGLIWGGHRLIIKVVLGVLCYQGAAGMPRLGDISRCWGVPDWKQWLIQILHDLIDRVGGKRLMTAALQPMLVVECGIRSRQSCESMRVDGMMRL
jgi:hypothetical protein